ncbi:MAG TPA: hypothetical protein PK650_13080 [Candidatus Sumerlaeota bacterium]|nr:hypothetical protein [Candidatus Sumerlaeota bacterium]HOE64675.1 hypothetical protein [Candidatus Sumerlaeota bacterium]
MTKGELIQAVLILDKAASQAVMTREAHVQVQSASQKVLEYVKSIKAEVIECQKQPTDG